MKFNSRSTVIAASIAALMLSACVSDNDAAVEVKDSKAKSEDTGRETGSEPTSNTSQTVELDNDEAEPSTAEGTNVPLEVGEPAADSIFGSVDSNVLVRKGETQSPTTAPVPAETSRPSSIPQKRKTESQTPSPATKNNSSNNRPPARVDYPASYLEAKANYDRALAAYNEARSAANQELKDALELKLAQALSDLADAQTAYDQAQTIADKDRSAIESANAELARETARVTAAISDRSSLIESAMKAVDSKQAEILEAQQAQESADATIAALNEQRNQLRSDLEQANNRLAEAETNLLVAQESLKMAQQANAEEVAAAELRLQQAEEALSNAQSRKTAANTKLAQLQDGLREAEANLVASQKKYDAKVHEIAALAAQLKNLVNQKEQVLATAKKAADDAEAKKTSSKAALDEAQSKVDEAEKALAKVQEADSDLLRANVKKVRNELALAKSTLAEATAAHETAVETYNSEKAKYVKLRDARNSFMDYSKLSSAQKMLVLGDMVAAITNQHRVAAGLIPLAVSDELNAKARGWSQVLADTKYATVHKEGEAYRDTNMGITHDSTRLDSHENVAVVKAQSGYSVPLSGRDDDADGKYLNIDRDPMEVAWTIANHWRTSHGRYSAILHDDVSAMSVGLVYDKDVDRIYVTERLYTGKADTGNSYSSNGLYMPSTHKDLFGLEDKFIEYTPKEKPLLSSLSSRPVGRRSAPNAKDWSDQVETRYAEGISDPRPTLTQVDAQKTVSEKAKTVVEKKAAAKKAADAAVTQKQTEVDGAQARLDKYVLNEAKAQEVLKSTRATLVYAQNTFGADSKEASDAKAALSVAQNKLDKAKEALADVPAVKDIDKSELNRSKIAVVEKKKEIKDQTAEVSAAVDALSRAEKEKSEANAQMPTVQPDFESEVEAVNVAESKLSQAQDSVDQSEATLAQNTQSRRAAEETKQAIVEKKTKAEGEMSVLMEAVTKAKSRRVDISQKTAAERALAKARAAAAKSAEVAAEKKQIVTDKQAEVNTTQHKIDTITEQRRSTKKILTRAQARLERLAKAGENH